MRDSYQIFMSRFNICLDDLVDFGLAETIFLRFDIIDRVWEEAKSRFERKEIHWIRGAGRDAGGTSLYQEFYRIMLSIETLKDPTNNAQPRKILAKAAPDTASQIINYQVSHVFGRTKNPILFTAPWNIVWKPKILDPFTGHEAKGNITKYYNSAYMAHVRERYSKYIDDYEKIRSQSFSDENISKTIGKMNSAGLFVSSNQKARFLQSIEFELGRI